MHKASYGSLVHVYICAEKKFTLAALEHAML